MQAKDNAPNDLEWYYQLIAREYYNDKSSNRYIHLADGGLVDNQGLQAILDEFDRNGVLHWRLNRPDPPLKRLVIINVNAGTRPDNRAGMRVQAPGLKDVVIYTMVTSMDVLSAKRWVRIQQHCGDLRRGRDAAARRDPHFPLAQLKTYEIEISFRQVDNAEDRKACFQLPTSFRLSAEELFRIWFTKTQTCSGSGAISPRRVLRAAELGLRGKTCTEQESPPDTPMQPRPWA